MAEEKKLSEKVSEYLAGAMEAPRCPICQSKNIHPSRPRLRDVPFLLLRAKPNRCMLCYRRFYTWYWFRPAKRIDRAAPSAH